MILCTVDTVSSLFIIHRVEARQHTRVIMQGFKSLEQSMITKIIYHTDDCYVMYFTFFFVEAHPHPIPPLQILALTLLQILHQNRHLSCVSASVPPSVYVFPSFLETEPLGCRRRNRQNRQTSKTTSKKYIFVTNKLTKFPLKQFNLCCGWIVKS